MNNPDQITASADTVLQTLFRTPLVVNLSDSDDFEVQPGVHSSVYINLKALASSSGSRQVVSDILAAKIKPMQPDYICGMEIGGCYFASSVADILLKDLFFYRKVTKKYNIKNCFAGNVPKKGASVVIIDDVLSSGNTLSGAVNELVSMGCRVRVVCIFSYCWEEQISHNLNVPVSALCNAEDLMSFGVRHQKMTHLNTKLIREYIAREESRIVDSAKQGVL